MPCKQCGHALEQSAKFCPNCGSEVTPDEQVAPGTCPKCGHSNQPTDLFCTECGAKIQDQAAEKKINPTNVVSERPGFQWRWALFSIPIVFGVTLLLAILAGVVLPLFGIDVEAMEDGSRLQPNLLLILGSIGILGMFLGGLVAAYWSKGRTIREPAVGIAFAVVASNLLAGNGAGVLLGWIFPLLLGMGGAWLGEWLQARKRPA